MSAPLFCANNVSQAGIIIIFCRLLHWPLSKLRQPRVIAEVIGGIILGPSVMMRIPGFQNAIFPQSSMPTLNLVANLGLILFLFLVGLEVNMKLFLTNWRVALSVGLAGMILPFGLGCAIAWGLYNQFRSDANTVPIAFPVYMLFIGTALSVRLESITLSSIEKLIHHTDHCLPRPLSNPHRIEPSRNSCWRYCPRCWRWQ